MLNSNSRTADEELKAADFGVQIATFELEQAQAVLSGGKNHPVAGPSLRNSFSHQRRVAPRLSRKRKLPLAVEYPAMEIGDPRDLEMEIDVLSTDAVKIKPGDKVIVEHWGGDAPLLWPGPIDRACSISEKFRGAWG